MVGGTNRFDFFTSLTSFEDEVEVEDKEEVEDEDEEHPFGIGCGISAGNAVALRWDSHRLDALSLCFCLYSSCDCRTDSSFRFTRLPFSMRTNFCFMHSSSVVKKNWTTR